MSETVTVNQPGIASQIQLTDCVSMLSDGSSQSAIGNWIFDVIAINHMTSSEEVLSNATLSQMCVAAMVAATENFYRGLFTDLVAVCPWTARNVATDPIPFGAVQTFSPGKIGFGLVEGRLFSSKGTIAKEIKRFTKYEIAKGSPLDKAIGAFDTVCAIRHAAVHWSGRFDTRVHSMLDPVTVQNGQHCINLELSSMQDCLAACDFLVRSTNQLVFDHTLNRWLDEGFIGADVDDKDLKLRSRALSRTFSEIKMRPTITKKILALATD